jgi:fucose permease
VPLVLLACLAYVSMAVPDSMLGVAWPWMRHDLHQPVAALGLVLPFGISASVLASILAGRLLDRIGAGRLLAAGTALSTASIAVTGLARSLWMLVAAGLLVGFGSGGLDAALNAHAARRFGARDITWMHASYGLGATVGPLVITSVLAGGTSWRWSYAAIGLVQAALTVVFTLTRRRWSAPPAPAPATDGAPAQPKGSATVVSPWRQLRAVLLGVLVFAVNTGIESGLGLWGYVFLTSGRGVPPAVAGVTVSGYWATMCVGRLVLGPVAQRVGTARVLAGAITGVVLGVVVLALPVPAAAPGGAAGIGLPGGLAIGGMAVIGLATAPVFPLLTLTTADRVGAAGTGTAVGAQVAASSVGGAGLPIVMGVLIGRYGGNALSLCLLVLAVLLVPLFLALRRRH